MSESVIDVPVPVDQESRNAPPVRHLLGAVEERFWRISNGLDGEGKAALCAAIGGILHPERVAGALAVLQKRHPRLRSQIVTGADGRPYFEVSSAVSPVQLRYKYFDTEELPWAAEAQSIVDSGFDQGTPLCQFTVLQSRTKPVSELIIAIHRSFSDGGGSSALLHELLCNYEILSSGTSLESLLQTTPSLPFMTTETPPITATWKDWWQMSFRALRSVKRLQRGIWTRLPNDSAEHHAYWSRKVLSIEESTALSRLCRKNRLPMYGGIFAATVTSLAEIVDDQPGRFLCRAPITMRELPRCERVISSEHLGCFISTLDRLYTVGKQASFWDLGREACEDLRQFTIKQGPAIMLKLLDYGNAASRRFGRGPRVGRMRETLAVDVIVAPPNIKQQYGDVTLEAFSGASRCRYLGPSLMVGVISLNRRLNFTLGAFDVSKDFYERFCHSFYAKLDRMIRGEV